MAIYKHYTGYPRPSMPETATLLGEIITQHMTRTESVRWHSDDHENDLAEFEAAKKRADEYSKKTMPPIWM